MSASPRPKLVTDRYGVAWDPTLPHDIDPHHTATGEWVCYICQRPLMGSYLRPVVPWAHRPDPAPPKDATRLPGLGTTE